MLFILAFPKEIINLSIYVQKKSIFTYITFKVFFNFKKKLRMYITKKKKDNYSHHTATPDKIITLERISKCQIR